jgi:hypothetical protein
MTAIKYESKATTTTDKQNTKPTLLLAKDIKVRNSGLINLSYNAVH